MSDDRIIDGIESLLYSGEPRWRYQPITYNFMPSLPEVYVAGKYNPAVIFYDTDKIPGNNFVPFDSRQEQAAKDALQLWADVANFETKLVSNKALSIGDVLDLGIIEKAAKAVGLWDDIEKLLDGAFNKFLGIFGLPSVFPLVEGADIRFGTADLGTEKGGSSPPPRNDIWARFNEARIKLLDEIDSIIKPINTAIDIANKIANPINLVTGLFGGENIFDPIPKIPSASALLKIPRIKLDFDGDVWINNTNSPNNNPENIGKRGAYGFKTLVHEIGHALGLKHPGNYNASGGGAEGPYLLPEKDTYQYSIMSYDYYSVNGQYLLDSAGNKIKRDRLGYPRTPMLYDIKAIQTLYGVNNNTRTGDTTYVYSDYDDPKYQLDENGNPILLDENGKARPFMATIWDAGGHDTIDASHHKRDITINLNPGEFSSVGPENGVRNAPSDPQYNASQDKYNLAIAYDVIIEDAIGGDGNDILIGNSVGNKLTGGAGKDTASYKYSSIGVFVSLTTGKGMFGDAEGDTLQSIEDLEGSQQADTLIGDAARNTLYGGAGNDKLFGQDGDDILNDPDGVIEAQGGIGNDTINITFASNWDDNDNLNDSPRSDGKIIGGYGDDNITVTMNRNDFSINLKADEDTVENTQDGNDTVTLQGNYANSTIYLGGGVNTFNGGLGKDTVFSGSGNDTLFGNTGNDILIGGTGINQIDGGSETDTIDYQNSSNAVTVNIDGQISYKNVGSPFDLERSFEINAGKAFDDFKTTDDTLVNIEDIIASKFNDILIGNSSSNSIFAGLGDDLLIGNAGNDLLDGSDGFDIVSYRRDPGKVLVNLQENTATDGFGNIDRLLNIEAVVGSAFRDRIIGSDLVNILFGDGDNDVIEARGGKDTIYGNDGNDSLFGESDDDKLIGGIGADILNGGDGSDTASYFNATSGIFANLSTGQGTDGDASGDIYQFIENLEGSEFGDSLFGDNQNNILIGLGGDDFLDGFGGNDKLLGGKGSDTYKVYSAGDIVTEYANEGIDTVNAAVNYILAANSNLENLNLIEGTAAFDGTGNELDNIINGNSFKNIIDGGAGDDRLFGFAGGDTLIGGDGSDWLTGGQGNDILTGGNGNDYFAYSSITDAGDRITDFTVGSDKIVLTEVVNSSGFRSFNPLADGFFSVRSAGSSMAAIMIDPDGAAGGSFRPAPFLLLNNVSASALNNSSNFVF